MCCGASLATNGPSFASHVDALRGANDGTVIFLGDADGNELMQIQSAGYHSAQLSPKELTAVKNWIALWSPLKID